MNRLEFSNRIQAPKEKVWQTLWEDESYRQWASVFSEGSHAVTDWKEGSKVLFLGPNGDGMYSRIEKSEPYTYMSIRHLGELKEGKEVPAGPETQSWANAMENYILREEAGTTHLAVELDTTPDFEAYFKETFPKALDKVKALAEA